MFHAFCICYWIKWIANIFSGSACAADAQRSWGLDRIGVLYVANPYRNLWRSRLIIVRVLNPFQFTQDFLRGYFFNSNFPFALHSLLFAYSSSWIKNQETIGWGLPEKFMMTWSTDLRSGPALASPCGLGWQFSLHMKGWGSFYFLFFLYKLGAFSNKEKGIILMCFFLILL
jgi:hypothetical protein